jgi:hypothetical protein
LTSFEIPSLLADPTVKATHFACPRISPLL